VLGRRWSAKLEHREYDSMLSVKVIWHIEAVINGSAEMLEWWLSGENRRSSKKNLLQCYFIRYDTTWSNLWLKLWLCREVLILRSFIWERENVLTENGWNCRTLKTELIKRSFITCTFCRIKLEWWSQDTYHVARMRVDCMQDFLWEI
jgi:hypothetical protein